MGLVQDDVGVDVHDGDVDAEGVGVVVGVFDFGRGGSGGGRLGLVGLLLFLNDDAAVVGLWAGVVGGGLGGGLLLLRWRWGLLGVSAGQGQQEGKSG